MLSHLSNDLLRAVHTRPLVSVAVSGDRYSVGYSTGLDPRLVRELGRDAWQLPSPGLSPARRRNWREAAAVAFPAAAVLPSGRRVRGDSAVRPAASRNGRHSIRDITAGRRACTPPSTTGRWRRNPAAELGALGGTRTPTFRSVDCVTGTRYLPISPLTCQDVTH
jgi:hypothetical protein